MPMSPDIDACLKEYQEVKSNSDLHSPALDDQLIDYLLETDSQTKIQIARVPGIAKSEKS
jgi:hypothetical protein